MPHELPIKLKTWWTLGDFWKERQVKTGMGWSRIFRNVAKIFVGNYQGGNMTFASLDFVELVIMLPTELIRIIYIKIKRSEPKFAMLCQVRLARVKNT